MFTFRESQDSITMSLTEEQRARMERMKKVAQEKKKWKDKAKQGGGGNTENSGSALPAVQSVPVSKGGQGGALYGLQSMSSSSGIGSSSSIATRPAPSFCGGSLATTAFYKPQAVPPPLPRGNFRPQEQPSGFKSQTSCKVCNPNFLNLVISFYIFSGDHSNLLTFLKKQV